MNRHAVLNAFQPSAEIDDPQRFAGRRSEVLQLTDALHVDGSVPLIYGDRGLGKSSLANQVARIAQGDVELLAHFGETERALLGEARFLTMSIACSVTTKGIDDLLWLMINAMTNLEVLVDRKSDTGYGQLVDRTTRRRVTIKPFQVEWVKRYETARAITSRENLNSSEKFGAFVDHLVEESGQPLLFVIDEFDRLNNTEGVATFLKTFSKGHLKFLVIGIGDSHAELLSEHESIARHLRPVRVPVMQVAELQEIIDRAEHVLEESGVPLRFSERARVRLAAIASGYPWFVHMIGQTALIAAFDASQPMVDGGDISHAVQNIAANQLAQPFADRYLRAVKSSRQREIVLRILAKWRDQEIPTLQTYAAARNLGVQNPTVCRKQLAGSLYGSVLRVPSIAEQGPCAFRDPMFKVYVSMRAPLNAGVDALVERECADF